MKLTAISIFPEYFAPLELSLIGKARSQGLVNFSSINLRDFTYDNHHTVDDAPYGGYRDWETDRKSTRLNSSH